MSYGRRKDAFILPSVISGHPLRSICFDIPDVSEFRQAFWGHLWELGNWYMWNKDSTADNRDQEAAAYWREILNVNYQRWNDLEECAADTCREYPPSAGFIQWFPNDPFLTPDLVGDGYNNPAWYLATPASNIAYGSSPGDVITSLDRFPPGSLPSIIPASGLPRFRINVSGAGTVKATLVNLFGGSLIQTTTDDDIGTLKFIDVSRDTVSVPPETQTELAVEFEFTTPGAHHIDFIVVSWVNSSIPFLHHGGGLRKVELCGFETMPVVTPPFRFTEGCGLEYYNGEEWLPVDGWTEFAPECFTADATIVQAPPAGFGNMQQNIGGAGFTDIANTDYLTRNGVNPMVGGLEILGAADEIKLTIRGVGSPYQTAKLVSFRDGANVERSWMNPRGDMFLGTGVSPGSNSLELEGELQIQSLKRIKWATSDGSSGKNHITNSGTDAMLFRSRSGYLFYDDAGAQQISWVAGLGLFQNQGAGGRTIFTIRGGPGQSTNNIFQLQSNNGTNFENVKSDGVTEKFVQDAATNTISESLILDHASSATPIAGFGAGLRFRGKSSTTLAQDMARLYAVWETPTHATRKAQVVMSVFDTSEREVLRGGTSGTAAKIGFLGATPVIRQPISGDAQGSQLLFDLVAALSSYGLINVTGVTLGENCCEQLEACTLYDFRVAQYNSEWSVTDGNWQTGVGIGPDAITGVIRMSLTIAPSDMYMTFLEVTGTNTVGLFGFDIIVDSDNNPSIWNFTHSTSTTWLRSSTFPFPHEQVGLLNIEIQGDPDSPPVIETVTMRYLALEGVPPGGEDCE